MTNKESASQAELLLKKDFPPPKKKNRQMKSLDEKWDFLEASSATDCTGLMPAPPLTEEEYQSYGDIQQFLPPGSDDI